MKRARAGMGVRVARIMPSVMAWIVHNARYIPEYRGRLCSKFTTLARSVPSNDGIYIAWDVKRNVNENDYH